MAVGTDLSAVTGLDGLRAALHTATPTDGWLLGWGLDHNAFGDQPLDRRLIEDIHAMSPSSSASTTATPPWSTAPPSTAPGSPARAPSASAPAWSATPTGAPPAT